MVDVKKPTSDTLQHVELSNRPNVAEMATRIFTAIASSTYGMSDPNIETRVKWSVECARKIAAEVERTDGAV